MSIAGGLPINITLSCSDRNRVFFDNFLLRFDKSVEGILNGRNAAMFVAIEAKKRGWNLEFEEVHYFIRDDG